MKYEYPSLGPSGLKLLRSLAKEKKLSFGVKDASNILAIPPQQAAVLMSRLAGQGFLLRLRGKRAGALYMRAESGIGENPHWQNGYILAREYVRSVPYYFSHYSAMALHQMLSHPVNTVFISSTLRPQQKRVGPASLRFIYCPPRNFGWGTEARWITKQERINVSDLSRTLLDTLDRPDLSGGLVEIASGLWLVREKIDWRQIMDYALKTDKGAVQKRLGFLVQTLKLPIPDALFSQLKKQIPRYRGYVKLDPLLPPAGKFVREWGLKINVDPAEIIRSTHT